MKFPGNDTGEYPVSYETFEPFANSSATAS